MTNYNVNASGGSGPLVFSLTGDLPSGLELDTALGVITGIPTVAGDYSFTIGVTDALGSNVTQKYTISPPIITTPGYLPRATINVPYSTAIATQGGDDQLVYGNINISGPSGKFNGVSDYVRLPQDAIWQSTELTVETWFKTTKKGGVILGYQNTEVAGSRLSDYVPALYVDTAGKLRGSFWISGPSLTDATNSIFSLNPVNDGIWHHVALVGKANKQELYLDGSLVNTKNGTIYHEFMSYNQWGVGYAGSSWRAVPNALAKLWYFSGEMDQSRVWTVARTQAEIQADMYHRFPNGTAGLFSNLMSGLKVSTGFSATGLPPGLSVNATTGVLSGTPTAVGPFSPTITVTDAYVRHYRKTFHMYIGEPVTLSTSAGPHGQISPATQTVNYGADTGDFSVIPDLHYHIDTVQLDGIPQAIVDSKTYVTRFFTVTKTHLLSATFAIDTYAISTSAGPHGSISPSQSVNYGADSAAVMVKPNPNYHIASVLIDGVGQTAANPAAFSYTFTAVSATHTVDATFAPNLYPLSALKDGTGGGTVSSDIGAIFCGAVCSDYYPYGDTVLLYATANPTSLFTGWSDCPGIGTCTVSITGAKSVTATFTAAPKVKIGDVSYPTLQAAYDVAPGNAVIRMQDGIDAGPLTANRSVTVTISGGYNAAYTAQAGSTALQGKVTLQKETVIFDRVTVR
jgi:hypothetical protein